MSFNEAQIETIREIVITESKERVATLAANLNEAEAAALEEDLSEWESQRKNYTVIKNSILGANIDPNDIRLAIINRVRQRFGLYQFGSVAAMLAASSGSIKIESTLGWF